MEARLSRRIVCLLHSIRLPRDFLWQVRQTGRLPPLAFPQRYAGAKTLGNALGILKDKLNREDSACSPSS